MNRSISGDASERRLGVWSIEILQDDFIGWYVVRVVSSQELREGEVSWNMIVWIDRFVYVFTGSDDRRLEVRYVQRAGCNDTV